MSLDAVTERLPQDEPVKAQMSQALDEADLMLARSRDQIMGLRGNSAARLDVHAAIEIAGRALATSGVATFDFRVVGAPKELREDVRNELIAIVTEALRNSFLHSQCSHINVSIEYETRRLAVVVADDGVGVAEQFCRSGRPGHGGIRGMHERARIIGANLAVQNRDPRGAEVVVRLTAIRAYQRPRRLACLFGPGALH